MLVLSIKPKYAHPILKGTKKVEFRKQRFESADNRVLIYSSSPEQKVVGYFTYKNIAEGTPKQIWKKFKDVGGIDEVSFFAYYSLKSKAFAFEIDKVKEFDVPLNPKEVFDRFTPPQSYLRLDRKDSPKFLSYELVG
jgi:predicted transcriptional regulator